MELRSVHARGLGALLGALLLAGCGKESASPRSQASAPPTDATERPTVVDDLTPPAPGERVAFAQDVGKVRFAPRELLFHIARDYDQRLKVDVENVSSAPVRVRAEVGPLGDGLLGSIVVPAAGQALEIAAGTRTTLTLALFAQDAERTAYRSHVALHDADSGRALAIAPLFVLLPAVPLDLEITVGEQAPGTLARRVKIKNRGAAIPDLAVRGTGPIEGRVTCEPSVDHGRLVQGDEVEVEVRPRLTPGFTALEGDLAVTGNGGTQSVHLAFALPAGKRVFLATSRSTGSTRSSSKYCTNDPNTHTGLGGWFPPGWSWPQVVREGIAGGRGGGGGGGGGGSSAGGGDGRAGRHHGPLNIPGVPEGDLPDYVPPPSPQAPDSSPSAPQDLPPDPATDPLSVALETLAEAADEYSDWGESWDRYLGDSAKDILDDTAEMLEITSPRGKRVRDAYLQHRPDVLDDNRPEARRTFVRAHAGVRLWLSTWHSSRGVEGKGRRAWFAALPPGTGRGARHEVALSEPDAFAQWPAIVALAGERALVVWESSSAEGAAPSLRYRVSEPGLTRWSEVRRIPGAQAEGEVGHYDPVGVVSAAGVVTLLWQRGEGVGASILSARVDAAGAASAARRVGGLPAGASRPAARLDASGRIHLAFVAATGPSQGRVGYARLAEDGASAESLALLGPEGGDSGEPDLLVRESLVDVVFRSDAPGASRILHATSQDLGATWSPAQPATPEGLPAEYPSLTLCKGRELGLEAFAFPAAGVPQRLRVDRSAQGWNAPSPQPSAFPRLEAAWLQIQFTLRSPRSSYRPHDIAVLFNGRLLARHKDVIPEGTWLLPVPASYLRFDAHGLAHNVVSLRTKHQDGGSYQSATDFRLQTRFSHVEQLAVASSQSEADALLRAEGEHLNHGRADVGLFNTACASLPPTPREGEEVRIRLAVGNLGEAPATGIRVEVRTQPPEPGSADAGRVIGTGVDVARLDPLQGTWVEVAFPFDARETYYVVARHAGADFDPGNDVHTIAFSLPRPPTIGASILDDPDAPFVPLLPDAAEAPTLWRILEADTGKEVARIERGRLNANVPLGRYRLALQRYPFEGEEVVFPRVVERRAGARTRAIMGTAIELALPPEAPEPYRWMAVLAADSSKVVQWHYGRHRVMLLPPGDYRVAIEQFHDSGRRVLWPAAVHLEEDRHVIVAFDSLVAPPKELLARAPPFRWFVVPDGTTTPMQVAENSWIALLVPPGRYRVGMQPVAHSSAAEVLEPPFDVAAGSVTRPPPPGVVDVRQSADFEPPYSVRLARAADGARAQLLRDRVRAPVYVGPDTYDVFVQPDAHTSGEVRYARIETRAGETVHVVLATGVELAPLVDAPAPSSVRFTREDEPGVSLHVGGGQAWGRHILAPGTWRMTLRPQLHTGRDVRWPTPVVVPPGGIARLVLDTGIRLAPGEDSPADAEIRIRHAASDGVVQDGPGAFTVHWLAPGTYHVDARALRATEWTPIASGVSVEPGRIVELKAGSLVSAPR